MTSTPNCPVRRSAYWLADAFTPSFTPATTTAAQATPTKACHYQYSVPCASPRAAPTCPPSLGRGRRIRRRGWRGGEADGLQPEGRPGDAGCC